MVKLRIGSVMLRIDLSPYWVRRCRREGYRRVQSGKFSNQYTHRAIDKDPIAQARSVFGEVGFAQWHGLDPNIAVDWEDRARDWDIDLGGWLIDIKSIKDVYRLLCWSVAKNSIWDRKNFHILFLMKVCDDGVCLIGRQSWIGKQQFFENKLVADGGNPRGLDPGTWYIDQKDLWFTDHFEEFIACRASSHTTG